MQTVIDARTDHNPALAADLIDLALSKANCTQTELAARCGVSSEYLRLLVVGKRSMSYSLQKLLEMIIQNNQT